MSYLLQYVDLKMEALDEDRLQNNLDAKYERGDCGVIMKGM